MVVAACATTKVEPDQVGALSQIHHKRCTNPNCRSPRLVALRKEGILCCIVIPIPIDVPMVACADCRQKLATNVHESRGRRLQSMVMERQQEMVPMPILQFGPNGRPQQGTLLVPRAEHQLLAKLQEKTAVSDVRVNGRLHSVPVDLAKHIEQSVKTRHSNQIKRGEEMTTIHFGSGEVPIVSKKNAEDIENLITARRASKVKVRVGTRVFLVPYDKVHLIYREIIEVRIEPLKQRQGKQGQNQMNKEIVTIQIGSDIVKVTKDHSQKIEQTVRNGCRGTLVDSRETKSQETATSSEVVAEPRSTAKEEMEPLPADEPVDDCEEE